MLNVNIKAFWLYKDYISLPSFSWIGSLFVMKLYRQLCYDSKLITCTMQFLFTKSNFAILMICLIFDNQLNGFNSIQRIGGPFLNYKYLRAINQQYCFDNGVIKKTFSRIGFKM